jgi:hypothetical protein
MIALPDSSPQALTLPADAEYSALRLTQLIPNLLLV